jgi:hypothetical protein
VSYRPLPIPLKEYIADIITLGIYIRIIIALPEPSPQDNTSDFRKEIKELKRLGVGYIRIDKDNSYVVENAGIPVPLCIAEPKYDDYLKSLQIYIRKAYDLYLGGSPSHGVQDLGQTVEGIIYSLGAQAKKAGKLTNGKYNPKSRAYYPVAKLIEDLMISKIINSALLGRCRGFIDDRNKCSHRPKNIKEAQKLVGILKNCWDTGLRILEELPAEIKRGRYEFHVR